MDELRYTMRHVFRTLFQVLDMVGLTVSSVTDTETGALLEYRVGQASFGASLTIQLPEKYRTMYVRTVFTVCTCAWYQNYYYYYHRFGDKLVARLSILL